MIVDAADPIDGYYVSSIPSKKYSTGIVDGQPSNFFPVLQGHPRWKDEIVLRLRLCSFVAPMTLVIPFDLCCDEMQTSLKTVTLWINYPV